MVQGQLDADVHQEEGDRGDGGHPVDALRDDPLAGVEDHPVLGDQTPDDRAGEADEREDTGTEVEELLEPGAAEQHYQGYEKQNSGGRNPVGRPARPGERTVTTTRVHGGNSERFGKAVPLPHSKWLHTGGYGV
ncbi:hypothetical protein GCM10022295_05140 [Streptomyces osmaniensis]|uniref:Uncharacterized protein n=1 Tax=Streptomyces osmaniensis TaxID=593134 RepID=A0ABP6UZV5_9ACTN